MNLLDSKLGRLVRVYGYDPNPALVIKVSKIKHLNGVDIEFITVLTSDGNLKQVHGGYYDFIT